MAPAAPLRVLFLNENLGGHATLHRNLQRALEADGRVEATFVDVPVPGLARRVVGGAVPGLGRLDLDLQPLRAQLALSTIARRLVRDQPTPDVLHVYSQNAGLLLGEVMQRVPTVVSTDTTNLLNQRRLPQRRPTRFTDAMVRASLPLERRVYRLAHTVVAQSEFAAKSLRDDFAIPAEKLRVLRFGVIGPDRAVARPGAEGTPTIVFVGKALERKGGNRLRRVFAQHLADRAALTLVTRERVPPALGVTVRNDIVPGTDAIWDVLGGAAIFALPSELDQSPNAVLEAMAAGLPVVASREGALAEVVEDGVTGFLVGTDEASLRDALDRLVGDPALRARMGAAAREEYEARWDARVEVGALVDVLLGAAGR